MTPIKDVSKFDYLRERPFLLVTRSAHPAKTGRNGTKTERKGWSSDRDNVRIEEFPVLVTRVQNRHLRNATVIIDVKNNRLLKNNIASVKAVKAQAEIERHEDRIAELRGYLKNNTGTLSPDEIRQAIRSVKKTIAAVRQDLYLAGPFLPDDELLAHYKNKYSDAFEKARNVFGIPA